MYDKISVTSGEHSSFVEFCDKGHVLTSMVRNWSICIRLFIYSLSHCM